MTVSRVGVPGVLSELKIGERRRIRGVLATCPPQVSRRLASLGFVPGAVVTKVRNAPMRDPSIYRVMDYDICLRAREAAQIECEPAE